MPQPKRGLKPTVVTIVSEGRNANATIVGQKIGRTQYKLDELEWPWLTSTQWSNVLKALNGFLVDVEFCDPVTKKRIRLKMYPGNRTGEPYWLDNNGNPLYYRNCKVNLIDAGYPIEALGGG